MAHFLNFPHKTCNHIVYIDFKDIGFSIVAITYDVTTLFNSTHYHILSLSVQYIKNCVSYFKSRIFLYGFDESAGSVDIPAIPSLTSLTLSIGDPVPSPSGGSSPYRNLSCICSSSLFNHKYLPSEASAIFLGNQNLFFFVIPPFSILK